MKFKKNLFLLYKKQFKYIRDAKYVIKKVRRGLLREIISDINNNKRRTHLDIVPKHSKHSNIMTAGLYNYKIAKKTHQDKLGLGINIVFHICVEMYTLFEIWQLLDDSYTMEYLMDNDPEGDPAMSFKILKTLKKKGLEQSTRILMKLYKKYKKFLFPAGRFNRRTKRRWAKFKTKWNNARIAMFTNTFFFCIVKIVKKVRYLKYMFSQIEDIDYYLPGKTQRSLIDFFSYVEKKYIGVFRYWYKRKKLKYYAYLNMYKNNWQAVSWEYKELLSKTYGAIKKLLLSKNKSIFSLLMKVSIQNMFNIVYNVNLFEVLWIYNMYGALFNINSIGDMAILLDHRIDNLLAKLYHLPKRSIVYLLEGGYVYINNEVCLDANKITMVGDWIQLRNLPSINNDQHKDIVYAGNFPFVVLENIIRMLCTPATVFNKDAIKESINSHILKTLYKNILYTYLFKVYGTLFNKTNYSMLNNVSEMQVELKIRTLVLFIKAFRQGMDVKLYNVLNKFCTQPRFKNTNSWIYRLYKNTFSGIYPEDAEFQTHQIVKYKPSKERKTMPGRYIFSSYVSKHINNENDICGVYAKYTTYPKTYAANTSPMNTIYLSANSYVHTFNIAYTVYSCDAIVINKQHSYYVKDRIYSLLMHDNTISAVLNVSKLLKIHIAKLKWLFKIYYLVHGGVLKKLDGNKSIQMQKQWNGTKNRLRKKSFVQYAKKMKSNTIVQHTLNMIEEKLRIKKINHWNRRVRIPFRSKKLLRMCFFSKWKKTRIKQLYAKWCQYNKWCLNKHFYLPKQIKNAGKYLLHRKAELCTIQKKSITFNTQEWKKRTISYIKYNLLKLSVFDICKYGYLKSNKVIFFWMSILYTNEFKLKKGFLLRFKKIFLKLLLIKPGDMVATDLKKYITYINSRNLIVNQSIIKNIPSNEFLIYDDQKVEMQHAYLISNVVNFFAPLSTQYIWNQPINIINSLTTSGFYVKKYDKDKYNNKVAIPEDL